MKIILILFFVLPTNIFAAKKVVAYEPAKVALAGHLDLQTFPGPPNYDSIKSGDEVERHFYLVLNQSIDVILTEQDKKQSMNSESIYSVNVLQLVVTDDKHWKILRQYGEGSQVQIKGSLFQRFTGHHHSRVLLDVENIFPVK